MAEQIVEVLNALCEWCSKVVEVLMMLSVNSKIKNLLQYAKTQPKRDYRVFSRLKNRLNDLSLTPEEYQEAVKRLARVLEV